MLEEFSIFMFRRKNFSIYNFTRRKNFEIVKFILANGKKLKILVLIIHKEHLQQLKNCIRNIDLII